MYINSRHLSYVAIKSIPCVINITQGHLHTYREVAFPEHPDHKSWFPDITQLRIDPKTFRFVTQISKATPKGRAAHVCECPSRALSIFCHCSKDPYRYASTIHVLSSSTQNVRSAYLSISGITCSHLYLPACVLWAVWAWAAHCCSKWVPWKPLNPSSTRWLKVLSRI